MSRANKFKERHRAARDAAPVVGAYICDPDSCSEIHGVYRPAQHGSGQCWHESLRRRLTWQYGPAKALLVETGEDTATASDQAAWNRLGSRQRRAA